MLPGEPSQGEEEGAVGKPTGIQEIGIVASLSFIPAVPPSRLPPPSMEGALGSKSEDLASRASPATGPHETPHCALLS